MTPTSAPSSARARVRAPRDVLMHDHRRDGRGVAIPYGIYDVGRDAGYVVVGTSRESPAFVFAAIASWWRKAYPGAQRLVVACDRGGANDPRRAGAGGQRFVTRSRPRR